MILLFKIENHIKQQLIFLNSIYFYFFNKMNINLNFIHRYIIYQLHHSGIINF